MSQLLAQFQVLCQNRQLSDSFALLEDNTRLKFEDVCDRIQRLAEGFKQYGVAAGQRVGLMLFNQTEFLLSLFALRQLGVVVVPINIQMLPKDIAYVIENAGIARMVVDATFLPQLAGYPLQTFWVVNATDIDSLGDNQVAFDSLWMNQNPLTTVIDSEESALAFLIYTSGTTGHPKGVMLSEKNLLANMTGFRQVIHFTPQDRVVMALPLFHAYGLIVALTVLLAGAQMSLIPKFHPKKILEAIIHEQATILPLVPTLFSVLLSMVEKLPPEQAPKHLRFCVSGGAALPMALLTQIESVLHAPVLEGYGLTETAPVLAVNSLISGIQHQSVGKPLPNVSIRIINTQGEDCPVGEVGEICAKGDNIMLGYLGLPQETEAVLDRDGWFKTGDLGHLDEAGFLYISGGRIKDLIIKAGENIAPKTIEEVLYHHPDVQEAAVVGIPDPKLGEDIAAFVQLKEGAEADVKSLMAYCRQQLSGTYCPARVDILPELPKNAAGKILKKLLREQLLHTIH